MTITEFMASKTTTQLRAIRDNRRMDSDARQAARFEIIGRIISRDKVA